jgi:hypothetical protein
LRETLYLLRGTDFLHSPSGEIEREREREREREAILCHRANINIRYFPAIPDDYLYINITLYKLGIGAFMTVHNEF